MSKVSAGRPLNTEGATQIYEASGDTADQYFDFAVWELPAGAGAAQWQQEVTTTLPPSTAAGARRFCARFVWSSEASDHINPAVPI